VVLCLHSYTLEGFNMYVIYYKIDELSPWRQADSFDNQDDAIEECGQYLYDGYIVRIEEE
jgi:hypothetical protein